MLKVGLILDDILGFECNNINDEIKPQVLGHFNWVNFWIYNIN